MSPTHRIIACLKSIQRKKPGRIIVALPKKIDEDTENEIRREMDELITTETVIEEQYIE